MFSKPYYKYLLLLFMCFLFVVNLKAETKEQSLNVLLRTISHEFLLQLNDSSTHILPIEKVNERYLVQFENEFSFEPDFLLYATSKVFEKNNITESFIVEVEQCETNKVVHSFKANIKKENAMTPCKQRVLPKDCY